jgi:hypothetical protein
MPDLRTKFLTLPAPPSRQTRRRDRRRRAMAGAGPQRRRAHRRRRLAVARPAALLRDQTCGAVTPKRLQQPPHLALAAPQELRRSTHRQPTTIDVPQHLETPQLAIAHAQHRHQSRLPQPATKPGRLTFLNWTALTFARWAYSGVAERMLCQMWGRTGGASPQDVGTASDRHSQARPSIPPTRAHPRKQSFAPASPVFTLPTARGFCRDCAALSRAGLYATRDVPSACRPLVVVTLLCRRSAGLLNGRG